MKKILSLVGLLLLSGPVFAQICPDPITLRSEKGAALSHAEGDQNFLQIRNLCTEADADNSVVTVCLAGCDYTTVTEAVDYVSTQTPGLTNPYTVLVYPGRYIEDGPINVPAYTALMGLGGAAPGDHWGNTSLRSSKVVTSGPFINLSGEKASLQNFSVQGTNITMTGDYSQVQMSAPQNLIKNVAIFMQPSNGGENGFSAAAVRTTGVNRSTIVDSYLNASGNVDGAASGTIVMTDQVLATQLNIRGTAIVANGDSPCVYSFATDNVIEDHGSNPWDCAIGGVFSGSPVYDPQNAATSVVVGEVFSPANFVTVCEEGCDYDDISDAADFVITQTPATSSRWVIQVYHGEYTEASFTMPEYTTLFGVGEKPILEMTGLSGNLITLQAGSTIKNMKILHGGGAVTAETNMISCFAAPLSQPTMENVFLDGTAVDATLQTFRILDVPSTSRVCDIQNSLIWGGSTAAGGPANNFHYVGRADGTSFGSFDLRNVEVKNIAGVTSVAKGFELINGASLFMSNSRIGEKYFGNPPIGSFAFLWDVSGSASELLWMANSYVETTNGGVTIRDTSLATSTVPGKVLGNGSGAAATSLALAANGTNCSTGNGAGGVDASGNAEDCTDYVGVAGAETITGAKTFGAGLSVSDGQTINLLGTTPKIEFANNMTMMRTGGATVVAYSGDGGSFNGEARYLNGNGLHGLSIVATAANVQINKQEAGNLFLNGSSIDVDTIVRGDTDANLLTVNAGEDAVNVGQATAGGTAGAKLTVNGVLHLVPIGTAPTNCSIGDFYSDTSGASCACTSTDTWTNMHGVGSCA